MINDKLLENYSNSLNIVTLDDEVRSAINKNQDFLVRWRIFTRSI